MRSGYYESSMYLSDSQRSFYAVSRILLQKFIKRANCQPSTIAETLHTFPLPTFEDSIKVQDVLAF